MISLGPLKAMSDNEVEDWLLKSKEIDIEISRMITAELNEKLEALWKQDVYDLIHGTGTGTKPTGFIKATGV